MLTQLYPFLDPARINADLAPRLRALADDCDHLALNRRVSPTLIQGAPLLEQWLPVLSPEGVRLAGHVIGHPIHRDSFVMTTALWFADPDDTWVRTLSRFYRLGPPCDPNDVHRALWSRNGRRDNDAEDKT
jgi:hypothetical protein